MGIKVFLSILLTLQIFSLSAVKLDSLEVISLHRKTLQLCYSKPDSAFILAQKCISYSNELHNTALLAKSYNVLGIYYDIQNQWDTALQIYNKAILITQNNGDLSTRASILNNIGLIYWNQNQSEKAIAYYEKSLKIFEELNLAEGIGNNLNNIGLILWGQDRLQEALKYQIKALKYRKIIGKPFGIGATYSNIGLLYARLNIYDSAKIYLEKAIAIKEPSKDRNGLAIAYTNYASFNKQLSNYDTAVYYYQKAIDIHHELGNIRLESNNLGALGDAKIMLGKYPEAITSLKKGELLAQEIQDKKELYRNQRRLAQAYDSIQNYEKAAHYYKISLSNHIKSYNAQKDKAIAEIEEKYQSVKREKALAEQKIENTRNELKLRNRTFLLISAFIIIGFILILAFIKYRQQQFKNKVLIEENELKDTLAAERIKHNLDKERLRISQDLHDNIGSQLTFIISSIDNLLFRKKNGQEILPDTLDQIKNFTKSTIQQLRDTIWALNRSTISGDDFIERLKHYCGQANHSLGSEKIQLHLDEDAQLHFSSRQGVELYRVIQEAINNAIKHAHAKNIKISIGRINQNVNISICDDGKGFNPYDIKEGNGLRNMKSRIEAINYRFVLESKPGNGSNIRIEGSLLN